MFGKRKRWKDIEERLIALTDRGDNLFSYIDSMAKLIEIERNEKKSYLKNICPYCANMIETKNGIQFCKFDKSCFVPREDDNR